MGNTKGALGDSFYGRRIHQRLFSMQIIGLANSISETEIVKKMKMLQVAPDHLEQVAISIKTLLDVNNLTVEEVTEKLRNVEQHITVVPPEMLASLSTLGRRGTLSSWRKEKRSSTWRIILRSCQHLSPPSALRNRSGGYQISSGWCAASVGIQHRAATKGALGDSF